MNVGQIARQAGGSAVQYADVPVVIKTASGKIRQVTSADYVNGQLYLTTGK